MDEPTAPALAQPTGNRALSIILVLLGVLLVSGVAYYIWYRSTADSQTFAYVAATPIGDVANVLEGDELRAPELGIDASAAEYVEQEGLSVAIVRTLAATSTERNTYRAFDMNVRVLGEAGRMLTNDGARKAWLAVSSDGAQVAYAFVDSENPLANDNPKPGDWSVAVLTVATGEVVTVGQGISPQFVDATEGRALLFATTEGLRLYDLATGASTDYSQPEFAGAYASFAVSPDSAHLLVRDRATGQHAVYKIVRALPELDLELVGYVPSLVTAALTNERVYGIAVSATGTSELRSYPLADLNTESRLVRALPQNHTVIRIIPQY